MNELVSIIIPAYNAESYILRSVYSVLHQSYSYIELIVIDDGSSDQTAAICEKLSEKDPRLQVCSVKNGGPARARNIGMRLASGQWIMFLDADDYLESQTIERMLAAALDKQVDFVFCNIRNVDEVHHSDVDFIPFYAKEIVFENNSLHELEYQLVSSVSETGDPLLCLAGPVCKLIQKETVQGILFPEDILLGEDTCFCLMLLKHSKKVLYIADVLYDRIVTPGSLSNARWNYSERIVKYLNWIIEYYQLDKTFDQYIHTLIIRNYVSMMFQYFVRLAQSAADYPKCMEHVMLFEKMLQKDLTIGLLKGVKIKAKTKLMYFLSRLHLFFIIFLLFRCKNSAKASLRDK